MSAQAEVAPPPLPALLPVYGKRAVRFTRGRGCWIEADDGRRYLDFTSGIAVNALGYDHPRVREAIAAALETGIVHTSNLFRTGPDEALAEWLVKRSFGDSVFFCNSGAEAAEAAIKFARRAADDPAKHEIVAHTGGFHGRTLGALAATDRPDYRRPFEPLVPGVRFVPPEDRAAARAAISRERTACVLIEPVQGEGGVVPVSAPYLRYLRDLCDESGAALVFDEVQCGLGRTGTLFAYEQLGVEPDMLTLAKPLAAGFPMGAVILRERIARTIRPGDHASTFGGGPFVASVALASAETIGAPDFLARVAESGAFVKARLEEIAARCPRVVAVRGRGLMWGVVLDEPVAPVVDRAFEACLLVLSAGPRVVRLLPPLTVSIENLDLGLSRLEAALR